MHRQMIVTAIAAAIAALSWSAPASAANSRDCGTTVDRGAYVDFKATKIVSIDGDPTRAASCANAKRLVRVVFRKRDNLSTRCARSLAEVAREGCRIRVPAMGEWKCVRRNDLFRVECEDVDSRVIRFYLRDVSHRYRP